jgi:hypothetical protein
MPKRNPKDTRRAIGLVDDFLWLFILGPVLAVSGWSLWWVATHIGVPTLVAVGFSACFDGAALLAARYSLKYAERGLSGTFPRAVTRLWAGLAAFVQTLHATLAGEPRAAALVWASLPITAVVVYEIHMRWVKREALARAGTIYPAALPGFGILTWVMFPWKTWFSMRRVVGKRKDAIVTAAESRPAILTIAEPGPDNTWTATVTDAEPSRTPAAAQPPAVVKHEQQVHFSNPDPQDDHRVDERRTVQREASVTPINRQHAPTKHIRAWAEATGRDDLKPGGGGKLKQHIIDAYNAAHSGEEKEAAGE